MPHPTLTIRKTPEEAERVAKLKALLGTESTTIVIALALRELTRTAESLSERGGAAAVRKRYERGLVEVSKGPERPRSMRRRKAADESQRTVET